MDPITRDLLIRLRWQKSMRSPIEEEATRSSKLERQQARALRDRWRDARSLGLSANRQEREQHRQRLKDLAEFKKRRAEAMGLVRGFGDFGGRMALWGGAAALGVGGLLAKGFVDAAREADNARMSIATMIQSADRIVKGPFAGVQDSFRLTTDLIAQMRQAALDTPAGFEDIQQAFRDIAVPARMAGSSYKDIIDMASDMSTLNKVLGFGEGVVSKDVQQLLRGDISEVQTPMLRSIRMEIQKSFKAGNQGAMLEQIRGALKIDPEMQKVFENSPEGRISQMRDEWEMFKQEAGAPVLAWISEQLKEALDYIKKNKEEVKRWAGELGKGVVDALKWIVETLKWMWTNREEIIGWAKWLAGAMGVAKAVSLVDDLYKGLKGIIGLAPGLGAALGSALGPIGVAATALGALVMLANGDFNPLILNAMGLDFLPGMEKQYANEEARVRSEQYAKLMRDIAYFGSPEAALDFAESRGVGKPWDDWSRAIRNVETATGIGDRALRSLAEAALEAAKAAELMSRDPASQSFLASLGFKRDMAAATWRMPGWVPNPVRDVGVTPNSNNDFRGSKFYVTQRVETNNPAALARASLLAGYEAVAKRPIKAKQRPGSVRLANGDTE